MLDPEGFKRLLT